NARGQKSGELVRRMHRDADSTIEEDRKKQHDCERSQQANFFRDYREDEIGMRFGQIEELLLAFHQSHTGYAAGGNRNQRLDDMKAATLRIGIRIHERQNALI